MRPNMLTSAGAELLARGQIWPAASIGCRQNGQDGRPSGHQGLGSGDEIPRVRRGDLDDEDLVGIDLILGLGRLLRLGLLGSSASTSTFENSSITIRRMVGSQAMVIVPTRNSSVIGASSGSVSRAALDAGGTSTSPTLRLCTSFKTLSRCSASTETAFRTPRW